MILTFLGVVFLIEGHGSAFQLIQYLKGYFFDKNTNLFFVAILIMYIAYSVQTTLIFTLLSLQSNNFTGRFCGYRKFLTFHCF